MTPGYIAKSVLATERSVGVRLATGCESEIVDAKCKIS